MEESRTNSLTLAEQQLAKEVFPYLDTLWGLGVTGLEHIAYHLEQSFQCTEQQSNHLLAHWQLDQANKEKLRDLLLNPGRDNEH